MSNRATAVARVLWLTLGLNWLVSACKIAVGLLLGNLTVLADGFHSLLDGANNVLGITAMRLSARPPDEDHPYGHRKFEHVAAMIIGGLVMMLCWEIVQQAIDRTFGVLRGSGIPERGVHRVDWAAVLVVLATVGVNLFVATYERRAGERLGSTLLKADSAHTLSDSAVSAMGVASLFLSGVVWWVDPLLAVAAAAMLLRAAWSILGDNIATMTDRSRLDPSEVRRVAEAVAGVENAHAIRSHGMESDIHLDLHIVVKPDLTAAAVAEIETNLSDSLRRAFAGVTLISIHHQTERHDAKTALWREI